ncbi:MAG: 6-bladed beta-propeller [Gemmatimonadota bacterium]
MACERPALVPRTQFEAVFEQTGNTVLQEPNGSVVGAIADADVADGDLYVADAMQGDIKAFATSGEIKRVIGRRGNGPTELQIPVAVAVLPNGRIAALDPKRKRLVWYDTAGRYIQGARVDLNTADDLAFWDAENVIVIGGSRGGTLGVLLLDTAGRSLAFMRIPSEATTTAFRKVSVSAAGNSLFAIRRDSSAVWRAQSGILRFDAWQPGQTPKHTVSWSRRPLKTRKDLDTWYRKQTWTDGVLAVNDSLAIVRFLSFPNDVPVFEHIILGTGAERLTSSPLPIQGRDRKRFWSLTLADDGRVHFRTFTASRRFARHGR